MRKKQAIDPKNLGVFTMRLSLMEIKALKYLSLQKGISSGELVRRLIRKTYPDLEAWGQELAERGKRDGL